MSPQVSREEWENGEQITYLTYQEMVTLIMLINETLETETGNSAVGEILKSVKTKMFIEVKPVLYDDDIKALGGE